MALKDLLALVDPKLEAEFNRKAPDPEKARQRALKGIDTTSSQWASSTPTRGRKRYRVNNSVVEYAPGFAIGGSSTLYIPSERFADFLTKLKATISAGELDDALTAEEGQSSGTRGQTTRKRAGWSPERRAAHEARMAAKRAGKA